MSDTQNPSTEEITTEEPPVEWKQRVEELEDMVYSLQDQIEDLQRDEREAEFQDQFNQQSNYGY